jgi:hypothetical protein
VRADEVRVLQVCADEVRVPQIDRMEVESIDRPRGLIEATTAEHGQSRLHVRGPDLQLGHLGDRRGGDVLAGQARRPGGVAANERGEDLADRDAVSG